MFTIRINSRKLTSIIMADYLGLDAMQAHLMIKLMDRKSKIPKEAFEAEARQIFDASEADSGFKKLVALSEAKSMAELPEKLLASSPIKQVQLLFTHLKEAGIKNAVFDVSLMRGFDYYTDIVFEVFDNDPQNNRSLFGGGRYDGLVGLFGAEAVPTIGFGMGDVTIADFLQTHELLPEIHSETDVYLVVIGDVLRQAQGVAKLMRQEGVNVAVELLSKKPEKQIKTAVKKNIPFALFVGEQELNSERFSLKDLATQGEEALSLERVIARVLDRRNRGVKSRSDLE